MEYYPAIERNVFNRDELQTHHTQLKETRFEVQSQRDRNQATDCQGLGLWGQVIHKEMQGNFGKMKVSPILIMLVTHTCVHLSTFTD